MSGESEHIEWNQIQTSTDAIVLYDKLATIPKETQHHLETYAEANGASQYETFIQLNVTDAHIILNK
ncbi:hypothetical protein DY000_02003890 [Brassica cretica]|uniref:Uncharacterized protein n=1 Tax=Brassica cretica TaxID=69181 RepID=A0ABQ7C241_BRACR|nr:hypothetical protein DY000_02003890 [Brassica cretica]